MWCLGHGLIGRNQPCEPDGLMRKGFMEEADLGGGLRGRARGSGSMVLQSTRNGRGGHAGLWAAPEGHSLCSHGRNWQPPSVPSARPSRSGMSWPMRLPTAAAKGEPWRGVFSGGQGVPVLWDRPCLTSPCPHPEPWRWRRSGAWRPALPSWRRSWRRSRATRSW